MERTLIGDVIGTLGLGGVTALLLVVGYGIGRLVAGCVPHNNEED